MHYRDDYPDTDNDRWLKQIVMVRDGDEPVMSTRSVAVTTMTPPTGVVPYFDMVKKMMAAHSDVGGHH